MQIISILRRPICLIVNLLNDISGLKYYWANDGSLRNDGIELNVKVRAVDIRDFKFDFGATIGHYKNKVLSLANGNFTTEVAGGEILTSVGHPVGLFYGYQTDECLFYSSGSSRCKLVH